MQRVVVIIFELFLVALSIVIGRYLAEHFDLIPRWILRLPEVFISFEDLLRISGIFLAICAIVFVLLGIVAGPGTFAQARRTAVEIYGLLFALSVAAVGVFMLTPIPTSPKFLFATVLVAVLLFAIVYLIGRARANTTPPAPGLIGRSGELLVALLRHAIRPWGILVILVALSPMIMAKVFVSNRDFANFVTWLRINASSIGQAKDWALVNAFGELRFRQPMIVQFSSGRSTKAFVLERHGKLYEVDPAAPSEKTLVLDISARVGRVDVENGALGFALHPQFSQTGSPHEWAIFLYYTAVTEDEQRNRLARYSLSGSVAENSASEDVLIEQQRSVDGFHNGGSVEFGPDGYLYLGIGEASNRDSHQSIRNGLFGGIFRLDVNQLGGAISHRPPRQPDNAITRGYFIPNDNPFVGVPGVVEEFWALGLRNPYRFTFDAENGELWVGDVGSDKYEEVNVVLPGHNYQFPFIEGVEASGAPRPESVVGEEAGPVHYYLHTAYDRAVIGGAVYRGTQFPDLEGHYLFADNYSGKVMGFLSATRPASGAQTLVSAPQVAQRGISSLSLTPRGDVLLTTLGKSNEATGLVLRLVRAGEGESGTFMQAPSDQPVSTAEAAELFNSNCARCHGFGGAADGPDAEKLGVPIADFTAADYSDRRTDQQLVDIIKLGGSGTDLSPLMPPWERILSAAEIDALVKHIRAQSTQD